MLDFRNQEPALSTLFTVHQELENETGVAETDSADMAKQIVSFELLAKLGLVRQLVKTCSVMYW
jgi:hypothetical protein